MEPSRSSTSSTGHPALHRLLACYSGVSDRIFRYIILSVVNPIHFPSISVASTSVSAFNVHSVSGVWDVSFDVRNTNTTMRALYQNLKASVYYNEAEICRNGIPRFLRGIRNETTLRTTLSAMEADVDPSIIYALELERVVSRSVDFTVELTAEIYYKTPWCWLVYTPSRSFEAKCNNISVALPADSSTGTLAGGSKECATHEEQFRVGRTILVSFLAGGIIVVGLFLAFVCYILWRHYFF